MIVITFQFHFMHIAPEAFNALRGVLEKLFPNNGSFENAAMACSSCADFASAIGAMESANPAFG